MTEANNLRISRLKLLRLESEKAQQNRVEKSHAHIFIPNNDLEVVAIAIATEGENGWKGSLYGLEYFDHYREHNCFIFATKPQESRNQQYLLVNFDSRLEVKYWIAPGETPLKDIYYTWAKIVRKPNPKFESNRMRTSQWETNLWQYPPPL
jgi:hypothetical protein